MRKGFLLATAMLFIVLSSFAFDGKDSSMQEQIKMLNYMDSVEQAMKYETGSVLLSNATSNGFASLKIPEGFKYLNMEQSNYVINKVWGNPPQSGVLGMLFPDNGSPFADSSYAYIITFDEVGYVKDDDADKINYTDLLHDIQKDEEENNQGRVKEGYEPIHMLGWAQPPFYDKNRKVLHWAKELQFGAASDDNTLNYDIRVLGRKGVLSFNAVSTMSGLPMVKADINKVLSIAEFTEGNRYADFDSNTDNIAAYTIGGLVAGKLLMKVGFWALILKFWKLVAGAVIAAYYGVRKFLTGRRKPEEAYAVVPDDDATGETGPVA